ncbi:MAG: AAA family ATPase [Thermodesulfovibrionales bacterium]|nr:AAA family ATPase [Thermodesulfovibrionales bacterium]
MNTKIIAFVNFKGGVGKTANVVNIGACLAKNHSKKVLIVDLDAQCNATYWLLKKETWTKVMDTPHLTVCQIFQDFLYKIKSFDFDECVIRGVPRAEGGLSYIDTLDILPASLNLLNAEDDLHSDKNNFNSTFFKILGKALKNHVADYDYVLIDCPPNIHIITKNALYFADYYIIPYIPDYLSLSGFKTFCSIVRNFQTRVGAIRGNSFNPRIRGIVINRFKHVGNVFTISMNELLIQLNMLKRDDLVHPDARIFNPPIRDCVGVAESSSLHQPVILSHPKSIGAQDYAELTINFLNYFEVIQ